MRNVYLWASLALAGVGCSNARTDLDASVGDDAAVMLGTANGTLGPWRSSTTDPAAVPPLPTPRANHCSATANGRLYVIGGNYEPAGSSTFTTLDDVEVADAQADGSLSAWRRAGTLPSAVNGCTATSDGTHLYMVGGIYDDDTKQGQVWSSIIADDGSVGAFTSIGTLPDGRTIVSSHAFVQAGTLFVFDTDLGDEDVDGGTDPGRIVLLRTPLSPFAWTTDAGPSGFIGRAQYAVAAHDVYALGGYLGGDNTVVATGWGAPFSSSTGMGASFAVSSLPQPRSFGAGAGVDDWVFVLGGKTSIFSGAGEPDVYAAHVQADGSLGAFTTLAQMPEGRTNLDAIVVGDYLYATGGGATAGGLDNVFVAQVRF
jgi:hypothetical protein